MSNRRDFNKKMIQAAEYSFPYHYLPNLDSKSPSSGRVWRFAASYIAAFRLAESWLRTELSGKGECIHIDWGCGDGAFINTLAKSGIVPENSIRWFGIDIDDRALAWARMFRANGVEFLTQDEFDPIENAADMLSLVEVLEHVDAEDIPDFMKAVSDSAKTGAQLFVTVPSVNKSLGLKHFRHYDFDLLVDHIGDGWNLIMIKGFEKRDLLLRLFLMLLRNKFFSFELFGFTNLIVRRLAKTYSSMENCGRIVAIFRKV